MLASVHDKKLDAIIGKAVEGLVSELRRIDVGDLVAYAKRGQHNEIRKLVQDAADLYFMPKFVDLSCETEVRLDWHIPPQIIMHFVMNSVEFDVYFKVVFSAEFAKVEIVHISQKSSNPDIGPQRLSMTVNRNSIHPIALPEFSH